MSFLLQNDVRFINDYALKMPLVWKCKEMFWTKRNMSAETKRQDLIYCLNLGNV